MKIKKCILPAELPGDSQRKHLYKVEFQRGFSGGRSTRLISIEYGISQIVRRCMNSNEIPRNFEVPLYHLHPRLIFTCELECKLPQNMELTFSCIVQENQSIIPCQHPIIELCLVLCVVKFRIYRMLASLHGLYCCGYRVMAKISCC